MLVFITRFPKPTDSEPPTICSLHELKINYHLEGEKKMRKRK